MSPGSLLRFPASCSGGLGVNDRLPVYGTAQLPEELPQRLCRLKALTGLSWNQLCDVLGVSSKQIRRWRNGIEPCGWAMPAITWVASQVPGGLGVVVGEGFVMSLSPV